MSYPTIVFSPLRNAVPAHGGAVDLLLRVQAPDQPEGQQLPHTPKRLSLVVDRSGSMRGEPLDEALKCVMHIAKHLTPKDELSIVVYDNKVNVLMPMGPMISVTAVQTAINEVVSGGCTDLHAGWLAGAEQLEGGNAQAISRVILLSDGQANHGLTDRSEIEGECRDWQQKGVTTTTVGLGRNFNEDLMVGMAQAGGGQNYYGQQAEDLFDNFDEELSLLQAMYVRNLAVKLVPAPGVVIEMLSPVRLSDDGTYAMTDLAWGAESWLAVRLHISPSAQGELRDLIATTVSGVDMQGRTVEVAAPLLQLRAEGADTYAAAPMNEMVDRRFAELRFAKASEQLRSLVSRQEIEAAKDLLNNLEREFGQYEWLNVKIKRLGSMLEEDSLMMMKEVRYSAFRMSRRLASKSEMRFGIEETESVMPMFLRRKGEEGRGKKHS